MTRVSDKYNFAVLYPELLKTWDYSANIGVDPSKLSPKSNKKFYWKCENGHSWLSQVSSRTSGHGCYQCSRHKTLSGIKSKALQKTKSALFKRPELISEIDKDLHPEIDLSNISAGSNIKLNWKCEYGHKWISSIKVRANGHGCPFCKSKSSRLEIRIFAELKELFRAVEWRKKISGYECDIFIGDLNIGIEIDGKYWHSSKTVFDLEKDKAFKLKGVKLIRIREKGLKLLGANDIHFENKESHLSVIRNLLNQLINNDLVIENQVINSYISKQKYINEGYYKAIISSMSKPLFEASLKIIHPNIAEEWHNDNLPLLPEYFTPKSHKKIIWQCILGHIYVASIAHRTNGTGCPKCAKHDRAESTIKAAIIRSGILSEVHPRLMKEWDYNKNKNLNPSELSPGSKRKVWWKCKNGHEWFATIVNRTKGANCEICSYKSRGASISNAAVNRSGSLIQAFPEFDSIWDYTKNGNLQPSSVSPSSAKLAHWKCKNGHSYQTKICVRVRMKHCPICYKNRGKNNSA
jgi:translation initiation factor IF-1